MNDGALWGGIQDRQPPSNIQAEQALLGTLLANNKWLSRVSDFLEPSHFIDPINGAIYDAILTKAQAGRVADAISLKAHFEAAGILKEVGGTPYLAHLLSVMCVPIVTREYGFAIHDAWMRRRVIEISDNMIAQARGSQDVGQVLADGVREVERLAAGAGGLGGQRAAVTLNEAMDAALARADAIARGEGTKGLLTGMASVDEALGGFEAGDLIVLGGRPGSGKSSLGWQWALSAARGGTGVLAFSLEMTAEALGRRALSSLSGVPITKIKRGQHANDMPALILARRTLHDLPLSIEDGGRMDAGEIALKTRLAQRKHGVGLIVVDHLQIVRPEAADNKNGSTAAITAISHAMKETAKTFGCPLLLLSQLSRGLESRDDHRPTLADLRQSGAIEEDADVVAFVYRPELHMKKSPPEKGENESEERYTDKVNAYHKAKAAAAGKAELIIEKLREGEPVAVPLRFHGPTATFSTLHSDTDPPIDADEGEF